MCFGNNQKTVKVINDRQICTLGKWFLNHTCWNVTFSVLTVLIACRDGHLIWPVKLSLVACLVTSLVTQKVMALNLGRSTPDNSLGQAAHVHVPLSPSSIIWQWCSLAGKVTADLAECDGSLPLGGWLCHLRADCLYTGISYGPSAWKPVWENITFSFLECKGFSSVSCGQAKLEIILHHQAKRPLEHWWLRNELLKCLTNDRFPAAELSDALTLLRTSVLIDCSF